LENLRAVAARKSTVTCALRRGGGRRGRRPEAGNTGRRPTAASRGRQADGDDHPGGEQAQTDGFFIWHRFIHEGGTCQAIGQEFRSCAIGERGREHATAGRAALWVFNLATLVGPSTIGIMELRIDRGDPLPLAEQVAAEIRRAIAEGEAGPGDRLPLAKDLAAVMGVNKNTVFRALHLLRDEGLLEFRRGHGITVAGTPEKSALVAQVRDLVRSARRYGYKKSDLIAMIEAVR
jgi:GntR family transcriptional regulator